MIRSVELAMADGALVAGADQEVEQILETVRIRRTRVRPALGDRLLDEAFEPNHALLDTRKAVELIAVREPDRLEIVAQQAYSLLWRSDQREHHRNREVRGELLEIDLPLGRPFVEQPADRRTHHRAQLVGIARSELGGEGVAQQPVLIFGQRDHLLLREASPRRTALAQFIDDVA